MKRFNLKNFTIFFSAAIFILFYFLICWLEYMGIRDAGDHNFIAFVRHVILVAGLIPLCSWLAALFASKNIGKLFLIAVLTTFFHAFVFAMSAHQDGITYWLVQFLEIAILWPIARLSIKKRELF